MCYISTFTRRYATCATCGKLHEATGFGCKGSPAHSFDDLVTLQENISLNPAAPRTTILADGMPILWQVAQPRLTGFRDITC